MFTFLPSEDKYTVAVEVKGTITGEDARNLDAFVEKQFGRDQPFNGFVIFNDVDKTTLKGLIEGNMFDAKRWGQFQKFAVLSDKKWVETAVNAGSILPGITVKHFDKADMTNAWAWIKEEENNESQTD